MEVYFTDIESRREKKTIERGRFLKKEIKELRVSFKLKDNDDCIISYDDSIYNRFIVTCKEGKKEGHKVEFEKTIFTKIQDIEEDNKRFINMTNMKVKPLDGFEQCKAFIFRHDDSFNIYCTNEKMTIDIN